MAEDRTDPTTPSWCDMLFYLPLGALATVAKELPNLAESGRQRVTSQVAAARLVGKFAVRQAGAFLKDRADRSPDLRFATLFPALRRSGGELHSAAQSLSAEPLTGRLDEIAAEQTVREGGPRAQGSPDPVELASAPTTEPTATVIAPAHGSTQDLALTDYDSIAASQIVARLDALQSEELEAIRIYESTHRQRRTVLGKIQQLQSA